MLQNNFKKVLIKVQISNGFEKFVLFSVCVADDTPCDFDTLSLRRFSKVIYNTKTSYCSDFRYESNGIFVLGWVFFASDKFRLLN